MTGIAVLGAGRIGQPVVARLVAAGHEVTVYDPREEARTAVEAFGAHWRHTAYDTLDSAQVVITLLPGSRELEAFLCGEYADLLTAAGAERSWIEMTSASPIVGRRFAAAAAQAGVAFLCAPLGGGPAAARDGRLTLYVGGDAAVLARHRDLLATIADPAAIYHVGSPEAAYTAKLLINLLWFTQAAAHGEALLLGQAAGISPTLLHELLQHSPAASAFDAQYVPRLLAGDYVPDFGVASIVEELSALTDLAREQDSPFPVSTAVTALYERAAARFAEADGELLAIAELEAQAGRQLRAESPRREDPPPPMIKR